ncbi:MAG: AtpZ/AtpI family protein [Gemmatimonadaceae bacterium]|nr:AtpZ/AtpI family protein [Gemmatimonadaceae bacterium]
MSGTPGSSGLRMAGAGVQFAAALIIGLYGGQWLDRRYSTAPVFLYLGVAVGAIGGMTVLYRQLMRATRDEEEAGRK